MKVDHQLYSNTRLLASLAITILLFAIFIFVPTKLGFAPLDTVSSPEMAQSALASMTPTQRNHHLALTAVVDSLLPLSYGYFFRGIALRFWGRLAPFLCAAAVVLVAVDFIENAVQIAALQGWADLLDAKAVITPLKLSLLSGGCIMAVLSIPVGIIRKIRST